MAIAAPKRPVQFKVYLSKQEQRQLREVAAAWGENPSVVIREFIRHEHEMRCASTSKGQEKR
jgi:hypothetical protein